MSRDKFRLLRRPALAGMLAATVLSVPVALAQTVANGPYYATPSWDQTLPAATRFIVLSNMNNEAVLDRETGLVWQASPSTDFLVVPRDALRRCRAATTGGRGGWRLPTWAELTSLWDANKSLVSGAPFTGVALTSNNGGGPGVFRPYYTSTVDLNSQASSGLTELLGVVFLAPGAPYTEAGFAFNAPGVFGSVWCVRGPTPGQN